MGGHWKANKSEQGEGGGESYHVCTFAFVKKNAAIFKMRSYSHSPVVPIDYEDSMKY